MHTGRARAAALDRPFSWDCAMSRTFDLEIEKVIKNGLGLGRMTDGQVVMVPRTLPGEKVRVRSRRRHKQYQEAELIEVLAASAHRIEPACPVYAACGGCDYQHVEYSEQLRLKNGILAETFIRSGLIQESQIADLMAPPLASPQVLAYRQRIRLQVEEGRIGFFGRESHRLVPVRQCPLAGKTSNRLLGELAGNARFLKLMAHADALEILENPERGEALFLIHLQRKSRPADHQAAQSLCAELPLLAGVVFSAAGLSVGPCFTGSGEVLLSELRLAFFLPEGLCGKDLRLSLEPGGFCQVNLKQNENCIRQLLDWVRERPPSRVLDLFCGMGNFSLPLALMGCRVSGMDQQRSTIRSATINAQEAGVADLCSFSRESALDAAKRLLAAGRTFDLILLDPPRSGCADLIPLLPGLGAGQIVAVSCDPATLARDLTGLTAAGYSLRQVRMVDMFPQTAHQETMVLLGREGN